MAIIAGFAMVWAIGWALGKGAEAAVNAIRKHYQARNQKFRASHPSSNRLAAIGATTFATLRYGMKPAINAFRDDWRKHYGQRRDAVTAKYAGNTAGGGGMGFGNNPTGRVKVSDFQGDIYQHRAEDRSDVDKALDATHARSLRSIPGGKSSGGTVPNLPTGEVTRIGDIRNVLGEFGKHMQLESDDAAAALQRAQDNEKWLSQFAEQSAGVLDKDPATAAKIASLLEPAHARVEAAKMHAAAADAALAASQQATVGVNQHSGMEEAVGATPQASSNTAVYAGN